MSPAASISGEVGRGQGAPGVTPVAEPNKASPKPELGSSPKPELVSSKCRIFPGGSVFVDSFCGAGGSMAQREGQVGMEGYVL